MHLSGTRSAQLIRVGAALVGTRLLHHPSNAIADVREMFGRNGLDIVTLLRDSISYWKLGG
jgi:hypothetical protein